VQGLLKTSQGTSPGVTAGDVAISLVAILLLYGLLFALWLYSLTKEIRRGPELAPAVAGAAEGDSSTSGSGATDSPARGS
jgi:cytochrome d ubiquinol oxidase subunit I